MANSMKRVVLGLIMVLLAFIGLSWTLNIAFRSIQFAVQELDASWIDRNAAGACSTGLDDLSEFLLSFRYGDRRTLKEAFRENVDADGDGMSAWAEILSLKSDNSIDSDGDGIPDPNDRCEDCRSLTFRDRVESLLVSRIICAWASGKQRVYLIGTGSMDPSVDCPETWFVASPSWAFFLFQFENPPSPGTEEPEFGVCELDPRLYFPGLIYVYEFDYYCGPLCAEHSYAFVIDVPILGPRYVGRKVLWVS